MNLFKHSLYLHLQDHKSHDILLLCIECHTICNSHENAVKNELSIKCNAPIGTERDVKVINVVFLFNMNYFYISFISCLV
jgi:hypothetical protein